MTILVTGRLAEAETEARNQTALILPSDGTQLGVVQGVQSGLTLTKTSGMGWQLDIGRAAISAATAANGPVVATVTVAETGTFANGDATRDRLDVVALQIDESATIANGNPRVKSLIIQGAYPVSGPPLLPTIPAGTIGLASVKIAAGTSAGGGGWNTANLTDLRGLLLGRKGRIEATASNSIPNATSPTWGAGPLVVDSTAQKTTDPTLVTLGTDQVTFRDAGEYSIFWGGNFAGLVNGRSFLAITNQADTVRYAVGPVPPGEAQGFVSLPSYVAAAGEVVRFTAYQTSGAASTLTTRVRIAKVQ